MLQHEEIKSLSPAGLELGQLRSSSDCQGMFYDAIDRRLSFEIPIHRCVRIVERDSNEKWTISWYNNLQKLTEKSLPGVCRPLEVGPLGTKHLYLIFDRYPAVLKDRIPATGLEKSRQVWPLLEQIARGLAELHQTIGAHGDLRSENIFINTHQLHEKSQVFIGHAELTGLAQWSNGARLCPETREIFPPEWQGKLENPSATADVYALGLLAIELFCGSIAKDQISNERNHHPESSLTLVRRRMCCWRHRWLLKPMLATEPQRFRDGATVLRRMQWMRRFEQGIVPIGVFVLVSVLLLIGLFTWVPPKSKAESEASQGEREALQRETEKKQELVVASERAEKLDHENRAQQKEINRLKDELAKFSLEPNFSEAHQIWKESFASRPVTEFDEIDKSLTPYPTPEKRRMMSHWITICTQAWESCNDSDRKSDQGPTRRKRACLRLISAPWDEDLKNKLVHAFWWDFCPKNKSTVILIQKQQDAYGKIPVASWLKDRLKTHLDDVMLHQASWVCWETKTQPAEFVQPWKDFLNSPWDEDRKQLAIAQLNALNRAQRTWNEVVERNPLTWEQFQEQVRTAAGRQDTDNRAQQITNAWIDQFNGFAKPGQKATIQLVSGTSPKGSGKYRYLTVTNTQPPVDHGHDWDTETEHTYHPPLELDITWQPGQPIRFHVQGERQLLRGGFRPSYIDQTFHGPVALWALTQSGKVQSGMHTLKLQVANCPGPPPHPEEARLKESLP